MEHLEPRCLLTVFVVNSTADLPDSYLPDGIADTTNNPIADPPVAASGITTLRAAIMQANFDGGGDTIQFDIGSGHVVISTDGLPPLTVPITIDGTTQPGYAGKPIVELRGDGAASGLDLVSNSTVKGLVVNSFNDTGIRLEGSNDTVTNCYVGTDFTGTVAMPNIGSGIAIDGGSNDTIGGTGPNDRNLCSGNAYLGIEIEGGSNNTVINNYVGTDITGTIAIGNGLNPPDGGGPRTGIGDFNGSHNTIGGIAAADRNLSSANGDAGIQSLDCSFDIIQGNYVGTDITGTQALGNLGDGVEICNDSNNCLVGVDANGNGANLISGNGVDGVRVHNNNDNGPNFNNVVAGNIIGLEIDGVTPLGNGANGVEIQSLLIGDAYEPIYNNLIGGPKDFDLNIISGNGGDGILITGQGATGNTVEFNYIGTDQNGEAIAKAGANQGNLRNGIEIDDAPNNTIGGNRTAPTQLGNLIAGNTLDGVLIAGDDATGNMIIGNNIGTDPMGKLALGNLQNGVALTLGANGNFVGGDLDVTLTLGNVIIDNHFSGVLLADEDTSDNMVQGNYIGVARDGKTGLGNHEDGVQISGATDNTIGGLMAGNIISANTENGVAIEDDTATGNKVQGNRIGLTATGTTLLGNKGSGVTITGDAADNTIGGDSPGLGNTIVGSTNDGVHISNASFNLVQGDFIGTDNNSTPMLGNKMNGVVIDDTGGPSSNNTIGGTTPDTRNIISGNTDDGILLSGAMTTLNFVEGNDIGTDGDGKAALANNGNGIKVDTAANNTIGGEADGDRNIISGNLFQGILLTGTIATSNTIQGNYIGTNAAGDDAIPNDNGIRVEVTDISNNVIGGETPADRNLISGNTGDGIIVIGLSPNTTANIRIQGNYIGTDVTGQEDLGNGKNGVNLTNIANITVGGSPVTVGNDAGNTIAFNALDGVLVNDSTSPGTSVGNLISRDAIFANSGLGIELTNRDPLPADQKLLLSNDNTANDIDVGANGLQNYPEITKMVLSGGMATIDGFLQSAPDANYTIEFFSNTATDTTTDGETNNFLLSMPVVTDGTGKATFHLVQPLADGDFITMTATDSNNNTSEISQDRDGDGLFDGWETNGIDINNDGTVDYDLKALGADPDHKDLFVEVDYMPGHQPAAGVLNDVAAAFAKAPVANPDGKPGITLHSILGEEVDTDDPMNLDPAFFALKSRFFGTPAERADPNAVNILTAKAQAFRYCLFANQQIGDTSSGLGEIGGNDFMVTLGAWDAATIAADGGQEAVEAGTYMHELGHTLGLDHGGGDGVNAKPNYLSVMNYTYQLLDLDPARPLDYSSVQYASLNENHLNEATGVTGMGEGIVVYGGPGGVPQYGVTNAPINWNSNGIFLEPDVHADINFVNPINGANGLSTLNGYDDWANLKYAFRGDPQAANGVETDVESNELTAEDALAAAMSADFDGDGIVNALDNAPGIFNPSQSAHNGVADAITKKSTTLTDIDGDVVTVTLKGDGSFDLAMANPDANHHGSIGSITLINTDQTSTLSITVAKKPGGDGLVDIEAITGSGLKSISASAADISSGIDLSGLIGSLAVHDILAGAMVMADGADNQATTITAHDLANTFSLQLGSAIKTLTAAHVGTGMIIAPSLGKLVLKGDTKIGLLGDLGADITLSGAGVAAGKPTFGGAALSGAITAGTWNITGNAGAISAASTAADWTATITGSVTSLTTTGDSSGQLTLGSVGTFKVGHDLHDASIALTQPVTLSKKVTPALASLLVTGALRNVTLRSVGNIGTVTAGGMFDSNLFAGVQSSHTGLAAVRGDFNPVADNLLPSITSVTIKGLMGQTTAYSNSDIVAWNLGTVALQDVLTDTPNSSVPFGIASHTLKSYKRKTKTTVTYTWPNKPLTAFPADDVDDLSEQLV